MNERILLPQFVSFIASPAGRWLRIAVGSAMIGAGISSRNQKGALMAAFGLVPLAAGALDFCVLGPMLAGKFKGSDIRKLLHQQQGFDQLGGQSASWLMA